jgi:hypothetical protein
MSVIMGTGQQVLAAPWRIPILKRVMPLATSSRNQVYESSCCSSPYLSPLHGPLSAWDPEYDVQQRMWELGKFWVQGVTAALYDALKHVKANPHIVPPPWILDGALKVVEDRLRAGFETKKKPSKRNDERKIYKSEIASYYRWREVEKRRLSGETIDDACAMGSEALTPTDYKGSSETMRKAYQRVSRDLQQPAKAYRYYSAMPATREIAGTSLEPRA